MLLVRGVRLPLDTPRPEAEAAGRAMKILKIRPGDVAGAGVARLSVDARHGRPSLVYTIGVRLKDEGAELAWPVPRLVLHWPAMPSTARCPAARR